VLTADRDWEQGTVKIHQGTVLYCEYEKLFKMWYSTGQTRGDICYAISKDGLKWEKSNLGICEYKGSRENNIVLSREQAGGKEMLMPSVIKKGSGYEMYVWITKKGLCRALSDDGLHWSLTRNIVLSANEMGELGRHSNDEAKVEYNPITSEYECHHACQIPMPDEEVVEYDNAPDVRRIIGKNLSKDGVNWTDTKIIIEPDEDDPSSMQFYGMVTWTYAGATWYLHPFYMGLLVAYDSVKQTFELELAYSRGGEKWIRVDRHRPFLSRGPKSSWDEGIVATSCAPVKVGNEHWIYYMGTRGRHFENMDMMGRPQGWEKASVGLARLGLDRFCSLDCPGEGGYVTTRLMKVGEELSVNLDASKGVAYVEILDAWFSPMKGFTKKDCDPITTNSVSRIVTWKGKSGLSALRGMGMGRIRLKFYLRSTDLYSFEMLLITA